MWTLWLLCLFLSSLCVSVSLMVGTHSISELLPHTSGFFFKEISTLIHEGGVLPKASPAISIVLMTGFDLWLHEGVIFRSWLDLT